MALSFNRPASPSAPAPAAPAAAPAPAAAKPLFAGLNPSAVKNAFERNPRIGSLPGTYWVRITKVEGGEMHPNSEYAGLPKFSLGLSVVSVVEGNGQSLRVGQHADWLTFMSRQPKYQNYFQEDVCRTLWCLFEESFREAGYTSLQTVSGDDMTAAKAAAEGADQPLLNTVVEVCVSHRAGKDQKGNPKQIESVTWRGVVPVEALKQSLAPEAKAQFPASHPVNA